ncbi:beta strand repeat-containing protein [Acidicapsa acidisoli]|uniref:beta strand repeat-containing protein n=1 Tax=Acidicapsa acidisoli TaxID=1615681 RepID=UPI0021DF9ED9|nr:FG-GAP-like repeat-containing protein [Acidicapsa acidisoli]
MRAIRAGVEFQAIVFLSLLFAASTGILQAQTFSSSGTITIPQGSGTTVPTAYPSTATSCTSTTPTNAACVYVNGLTGNYTSMSITLNYSSLSSQSFPDPAILLESPSGKFLDILSFGCAYELSPTSVTFTLVDNASNGLFPPAYDPNSQDCPASFANSSYEPAAYEVSTDNFPSPGPGNSGYTVAGNGSNPCAGGINNPCTSGDGTFANTFCPSPSSCVSGLNGTWKLYAVDQGDFLPSPATVLTWSLTFNVTGSNAATTTTLQAGSPNPAFTSGTGDSVSFTAHVEKSDNSGPATTGTVTLHDNTTNTNLVTASVDSSGNATLTTTFTTEGTHNVDAVYNGGTGFAASAASNSENQIAVNHATNPSSGTFCNPGPITLGSNTGGTPYPSRIVLGPTNISGDTEPTLSGTIETVTVSLNGFNLQSGVELDDLGLLLQAPGTNTTDLSSSGNAFEFLSWAGNPFTSGSLTMSDTGASEIPAFSAPTCTTCLPTDDHDEVGSNNSDSFPSPAPTSFVTAAPTGSGTFLTEFGGGGVSGTWSLYLDNRLTTGGTLGSLGSWCLNFTTQTNAHPTSTTVSGSPNPVSTAASTTLTANVSVTDGSGLTVNAGTVTFVDGSTNLGSSSVVNGVATLSKTLTEGTHQIVASYSGTNTGTEFGISSANFNQRVDHPTAESGTGPYTYCNAGPITAPGLGVDAGAAAPYPSNIFVTNLPGTVDALTVTLHNFSTDDQGDLLSLLVGPGGNNLDFFSLTGSNDSGISPINLTFADSGSSIGGNITASGTYRPTSANTSITYPQCPPNASNCASPAVGPPLPSNPFTPTNKAESAGTGILGDTSTEGVFGGTSASTYNGNGTWSLYMDDGGPTGGGELTNVAGGWCVNFTENLPTVTVAKSHSGTLTQGQQGVPFTIDITNNGRGPTGDPTGGSNPLTVTDTLNSAYAYAGFSGTGWSCSATGQTVTCTNDSTVAQESSYGALTIDVNVSATASTTSSVTNQVQVSGGGVTSTSSNVDSVTILPAAVLAVQKTHTGTFMQGQTAQWNIAVSNTASGGSTYGTISVSDTLPTGYTLASYTSTGSAWSCSGASTITCTTTATISGGADSVITLTVNVPANSPVSVTNTAKAWGGGDLTHTSLASAASGADTAAVVQVPASVTINNGGGTQSTTIDAAFGTPLSVTVDDANSVVIPSYSVVFTSNAGVNGQSGTFSNSTGTITIPTSASGIANAGAFTANSKAGSYTVTAVAGSVSATFNLTNTPGAPANIVLTSGSGQSTAIHTSFTNPLIATLTDVGGNPLSGVTVTFTAPTGLTPSLAFSNASNTISEPTNGLGQASSGLMTANGIPGGPYNVQAAVGLVTNNFQLTNLDKSLTTFAALSANSATIDVFGFGLTPPSGQLAFTDLTTSSPITSPVTLNTSSALTSLQPQTTTSTGANSLPDWTELGDVNGDGKLDLITSVFQTDSISVQLGNGDGTFGAATNYLISSGFGPSESHLFSLRGNGVLDIVVASYNLNQIAVLLGNGNGTFQSPQFYTVGTAENYTLSIAAGDFNHDGNLDLAIVNGNDNTVSIALGNGTGSLTVQSPAISVGEAPVAIRSGDFNSDGYSDLAVANFYSGTVTTLLNNKNGTFTPTTFSAGSGVHSGPEALAIQGSGDSLQLAVANYNDDTVSVYNSNGNGTFATPKITSVGKGPDDLNFADFNGVEELVVSNYTDGSVDLLIPNGSVYTLAGPFKVGTGPYSAAVGDIDLDGTPDVVVSNCFSNNTGALLSGTQISVPYSGLSLVAGHSIQAAYTPDGSSKYGASTTAATTAP